MNTLIRFPEAVNKLIAVTRFLHFLQEVDQSGCWLWRASSCFADGYGHFSYGKGTRAHRAAWLLWKGEIPDGLFVCHKCDVRNCVNPDHLFLGTCKDNIMDCVSKGRLKGRQNAAKLKPEDIPRIRNLRATGMTQREIGTIFNVRQSTIHLILNGTNWAGY